MSISLFSTPANSIRACKAYEVINSPASGDYLYSLLTPTQTYTTTYTGAVWFKPVLGYVGNYFLHIGTESATDGNPAFGIQVQSTSTLAQIHIVYGTFNTTTGEFTTGSNYSDGRNFSSTINTWHKVCWYHTGGADRVNSGIWFDNVYQKTTPNFVAVGSSIHGLNVLFPSGTPTGLRIAQVSSSIDASIVLAGATALNTAIGLTKPKFLGYGPQTVTGKIRTLYVDNGAKQIRNMENYQFFTRKGSGPDIYQQVEENVGL